MKINKWVFIAILFNFSSIISTGQEFQFMFEDSMRSYVVYEPSLAPNPDGYPLVIGLHGTGSDAYGMMGTAALVAKANQEQFIVACPNALNINLFTYFNAGGGYEELTHGINDLGFITAVIDSMIANYNIDTTRIYALGHSNGSMMAYRLAAELSYRIAAIGANAGPMLLDTCNPEYPVPIIHFHGLSDPLCPYEGTGDSILVYPPVDTTVSIWCKINGCSEKYDTIFSNDSGIVGKKWTSVSGESDIILYTIPNMPHKWSRESNYGIQTTDVMWDFLKLQSRNIETISGVVNKYAKDENLRLYQNYPNPFSISTLIKYSVHKPDKIVLRIYNLAGQEVETLVNEFQPTGDYEFTWQPKGLPGGLYFYKIQADEFSETHKLIIKK